MMKECIEKEIEIEICFKSDSESIVENENFLKKIPKKFFLVVIIHLFNGSKVRKLRKWIFYLMTFIDGLASVLDFF